MLFEVPHQDFDAALEGAPNQPKLATLRPKGTKNCGVEECWWYLDNRSFLARLELLQSSVSGGYLPSFCHRS